MNTNIDDFYIIANNVRIYKEIDDLVKKLENKDAMAVYTSLRIHTRNGGDNPAPIILPVGIHEELITVLKDKRSDFIMKLKADGVSVNENR